MNGAAIVILVFNVIVMALLARLAWKCAGLEEQLDHERNNRLNAEFAVSYLSELLKEQREELQRLKDDPLELRAKALQHLIVRD